MTWDQIAAKIATMTPEERTKPALRFDEQDGELVAIHEISDAGGWVGTEREKDGVTETTPVLIEDNEWYHQL